jgi:curved DNA-binding protein CbpA
MIPNYYNILKIGRNSTKEIIKKAYRQLALKWHPDVNKSPDAHERFIEINEAYLILSDEEARVKYNIEYDFHFRVKTEDETAYANSNDNQKNEQARSKTNYKDPDLNNWTKSARKQAEKYAFMSFKEFSKMVGVVLVETGKQSFIAIIYAVSAVIGASGLFSLFFGVKYGDTQQIFLSLLFIGIAIIGINFTSKKHSK